MMMEEFLIEHLSFACYGAIIGKGGRGTSLAPLFS